MTKYSFYIINYKKISNIIFTKLVIFNKKKHYFVLIKKSKLNIDVCFN